ncbi:MAG: sigma-70 family RNA polymerase sigma factor, partial [Ignavibacteriaceae bacterium]
MEQDNKFIKSLIESAQNGKVVALEELYKMNIDRIYAIALRLTGNGPLAGLLVQNVLINAWRQLKRIRADVLFADWLKSMTIYDTLSELRKGKLQNDKKSIKQFKEDGKADSHFHEPLEKAISELQDNQRIVVVLNLIENYSISEIGDLLSLSETETQNILENAVQKVGESVSKKAPDTKVTELIKNLPTEIQPHTEIIPWVLEFIREVKTEEFKEAEKTVREEEEPTEEKDEEELERE